MWLQFRFVYNFRNNSTAVLGMLHVGLQLVHIESKMAVKAEIELNYNMKSTNKFNIPLGQKI